MTREQLEKFAHAIKAECEREREERNFFQLERDKLRVFWKITQNQLGIFYFSLSFLKHNIIKLIFLEEARLQIRTKEREAEVSQELAEMDMKHTTQQMKHLQYENQTRIGEIRAEGLTQLKLAQEDHALQEQELFCDKREVNKQLREKEEQTEMQMQQLKIHQSESLT